MTTRESIKLLTELRPMLSEVGFDKFKSSLSLAIEALHLLVEMRVDGYALPYALLPGETNDRNET